MNKSVLLAASMLVASCGGGGGYDGGSGAMPAGLTDKIGRAASVVEQNWLGPAGAGWPNSQIISSRGIGRRTPMAPPAAGNRRDAQREVDLRCRPARQHRGVAARIGGGPG